MIFGAFNETPTMEGTKMNDKQIETIKDVAKFVVSHSVSATAVMALNNVASPSSKRKKLELSIGAYVIGSLIADKTDDWVDAKIDSVVNMVKKVQALINGEPTKEETPQDNPE